MNLPVGMNRWYLLIAIKILCAFFIALTIGLVVFKFTVNLAVTPKPWQIFSLIELVKYYPVLIKKLIMSIFIGFSITIGFFIIYLLSKYQSNKNILGNAHFASALEIQRAGFFENEGIIVGKSLGKPIRAGGFEHVLAFAPAGSGKTTSIAIPNLLTWRESCVVNDPKFELFETTSGYRKKAFKNDVFLWAPTRHKTHRYNPLRFISQDKFKRIGEIQLMAHVIFPNVQTEQPIWRQSARQLFLALVLYMIDSAESVVSLPQLSVISKGHRFNEWLFNLIENTTHFDPEFYRNASAYLCSGDKTRDSIKTTFTACLEIFSNPIINAAVSDSDFDLRDLRRKKITIYIGFSENEKEMISPLLTIFWQQLISFMTEQTPNIKTEPYSVLCLMEEFSILGRLVNLKSSLKILRGYRVRVLIIIQYLSQLLEFYSKAEAESFKNIKTKIIFAPDSLEDAEYISKMLGQKTIRVRNHSSTSGSNNNSSSQSHHLQAVPLMRPEELQRLKSHKAIVIRTGSAPVLTTQYRWYKQSELKNLPCASVSVPIQNPIIIPFEKNTTANTSNEKSLSVDDLEKEKLKIQAEMLSDALLNTLSVESEIK